MFLSICDDKGKTEKGLWNVLKNNVWEKKLCEEISQQVCQH